MMSPLERWSLHLSALATIASGLIHGWLKYCHQRMGEFGPEPFWAQGLLLRAHVLVAPLLVFTLGVMVRGHLLPALRAKHSRGRGTGLALAALLAPMIVSGYAVQVCVDPAWRTALAWVHGPFSLLFLLAYGAHLARPRAKPL